MGDHVLADHGADCPAHRGDNPRSCPICDGGLALCTVCGGREGSLPSRCPGTRMTHDEANWVYEGILDFTDEGWITPPPRGG